MNSQKITTLDTYIVMWDMYGLESLVNVSEGERGAVVSVLKGEKIEWRNPIQYMILRARFNSQRCYEIYSFTSEIPEDDIIQMFKSSPQIAADTIRRIGQKLYSDRTEKKAVIT